MTHPPRPPGRNHLSISTRLTLWYGLTLFVLLSLYALFCYTNFQRGLERDFDYHLRQETEELLPFIRLSETYPTFVQLEELRSVAYQSDGYYGIFVRLLSATGTEHYRSPNYEGHNVLPAELPDQPRMRTVSRLWENKPIRTEYTPLKTPDNVFKGWLEVTAVEWTMYRDLSRFGLELALGILLIVALAAGGGYWLARRALQPVATLTRSANQIRTTDLSARLPTEFGVRDEMTELAETLNNLISRLDASLATERRLTANAAHELLTPLTTMRGEIDLSLRRMRDADSYQLTLKLLLRDTDTLIQTVHHLLQLSHTEQLQDLPREAVPMSKLVTDQIARFRTRADDRHINLRVEVAPNVWVIAHPVHLGQVLNNLLDNALKYTPDEGAVTVRLWENGETAHLVVADTGAGFTEKDKENLFDRFYRSDDPSIQSQFGSGLGLAIVQQIVTAYDGTITAQSNGKNRGSTFEITLPRL